MREHVCDATHGTVSAWGCGGEAIFTVKVCLRYASTMQEQPPLPLRRRQAFSNSCAAASGGGSVICCHPCGKDPILSLRLILNGHAQA